MLSHLSSWLKFFYSFKELLHLLPNCLNLRRHKVHSTFFSPRLHLPVIRQVHRLIRIKKDYDLAGLQCQLPLTSSKRSFMFWWYLRSCRAESFNFCSLSGLYFCFLTLPAKEIKNIFPPKILVQRTQGDTLSGGLGRAAQDQDGHLPLGPESLGPNAALRAADLGLC